MAIYEADPDGSHLRRLTDAPGYNAEGSYSPDGKQIVFCSNRTGPENLELFVMDADGKNVRQLTHAPGCYNGGPFFSPDGKRVAFRSDRKKKDHLQLYVINADGTGERALTTNDKWVYWAPFWYKDGRHIIYTAADHSDETKRPNYDLYWMNTETGKTTRLTYAPGADVLPVFSPDGKKLMWTSTRDGRSPAQLYIADFTPPTRTELNLRENREKLEYVQRDVNKEFRAVRQIEILYLKTFRWVPHAWSFCPLRAWRSWHLSNLTGHLEEQLKLVDEQKRIAAEKNN